MSVKDQCEFMAYKKTMHQATLTALLANYTTTSTSCNGIAGINVGFSTD